MEIYIQTVVRSGLTYIGGDYLFNILVVEDDKELSALFCTVLRKAGYRPIAAVDGVQALGLLEKHYMDLIITDMMMPRMDGFELIDAIRVINKEIPILVVTARDSFFDMQKSFRKGSDDYMVKPINVNEMLLRVEALLRRAKILSERKINIGNTVLEYDALSVTVGDGNPEVLPQKEFYLLYKLLSVQNRILTRQQLMDEIWGMDSETEARTVDVHIGRLRDRFKQNEDFEIVTVRGLGYKAVKK